MPILSLQKQSQNTDFPNLRPSLDLRFALAKKLDPRITFTRGSIGTRVNESGLIEVVPANVPRFDHDPITGQSLGLLIEESRQNLLTYSQNHKIVGTWINSASISNNNTSETLAPDGTNTATKLIGNSGERTRQSVYQRVSVTSGTTYTFSVFLKAAERRYVCIWFDNFNVSQGPFYGASNYIDLQTGTIPYEGTSGAIKIIPYPNGWYRLYVTATPTITGSFNFNTAIGTPNNYADTSIPNTFKYTGDDRSGVYIWGSQVEAGAFPTSYIPTSGSQVTRSADNASMTGTNFSNWYNQSEGTIVISTDKLYSGNFDAYSHPYSINNGVSSGSEVTLYTLPSSTSFTNYGISNGGRQVFDYQTINIGSSPTQFKVGQSINSKYSFFTSSKGTTPPQLPSKSSPNGQNLSLATNMNQLSIGSQFITSFNKHINSHISRFTYYPIQITNQQLINLNS
jgi:hypothetical protein